MARSRIQRDAQDRAAESARCKRRARRLLAIIAAPAVAALIAATASAESGKAKSSEPNETSGRNSKTTNEKKGPGAALPVSLAEVASRVDEAALAVENATEVLRSDVEAEIAAADWSKLPPRRHYKLSASIVSLRAESLDKKTLRATCTVSVSIRDAKRNNLLAILEGRANVTDMASASARAQRDALQGAVRGAIAAVPEAIRQAQ
ncbi:MAG: hypothetical protein L6Q76_26270 [Polyangiaceae bacterium]|nr:hypothetical protein [Polyangiaceae bacterium]